MNLISASMSALFLFSASFIYFRAESSAAVSSLLILSHDLFVFSLTIRGKESAEATFERFIFKLEGISLKTLDDEN